MLAPSPTPLVPMVGPSRRMTGPVVESSRPSIAFARVTENVHCTTPLHAVSRSLRSILRRTNVKLCVFCRYLVEKTRASRKRYLDYANLLSILRRTNVKLCVFCRYLVEKTRASRKRYLDYANLLSILRRTNVKLCVFCRYHVEKTYVHEMSTWVFSSIHVYSLEIRALQGNATWDLQTCCRYYDK